PVAEIVALDEPPAALQEDQEDGLERILGISRAWQNAPADAEDHGPVAAQERLEGRLVALEQEALQKPAIGQRGQVVAQRRWQLLDERSVFGAWHVQRLAEGRPPFCTHGQRCARRKVGNVSPAVRPIRMRVFSHATDRESLMYPDRRIASCLAI